MGLNELAGAVRLGIFELLVGAVEAAFVADVVAVVEFRVFLGGGVTHRVLAIGQEVEFVLQIQGAEHAPAGSDEFVEEDFFERSFGLALRAEFVSQIAENRAEFERDGLGG